MRKNKLYSIKLHFIQDHSSLKKIRFLSKALVVFILSLLFVVPTPVLALVNTKTLQNYVASVRSETSLILQLIDNLPSQSNDEAFKTIASIENSIDRLSNNAAERAEEFQSRIMDILLDLGKLINRSQ